MPESAGEVKRSSYEYCKRDTEKVLGVKDRRARDILKEMTGKGILERVGSAANTHYRERSKN